MKNKHRAVLFLLYASVSTSLALAALPSTAAAVSLLSTVWLSFVMAISFTESWVKFKAPTLSKASAVDAGRHVFSALNSVEAGIAVALVAALYLWPRPAYPFAPAAALEAWRLLAAVPLAALAVDVSLLTPALDRRARELIVSSWRKVPQARLDPRARPEEEEEKGEKKTGKSGDDEEGGEEKKRELRARAAVAEMVALDRGTPVPPAWLHGVYVLLEAVKVVSLALLVKSAGRGAFV